MKAAVVERPNVLAVREVPMPEVGPYDALCELLYGSTCTGTDQHLIKGEMPWHIDYPTILGHESIGRVIKVGPKVRNLGPGDLVTRVGAPASEGLAINWGGFAEYGIARDHWAMREDGVPEGEWRAYRVNQLIPPGSDPRAATLLITWRETFSYITRMGVGPGARVLVIGSGGNGLSFAAHASNLGATEVAVIGNAHRETNARAVGATLYFDYRSPNVVAGLAGREFDYAIDAVGQRGQIDLALPYLTPGGMVGIYGIDELGRVTINPSRARGTFTYYNGKYDEAEAHERIIELWCRNKLDASVWVDMEHPFPLDQIADAIADAQSRRVVKGLVKLQA